MTSYIWRRVFVLNSNLLAKRMFHVRVFAAVIGQIPEKRARYVYLIQINGAQNCSRMCMCSDGLVFCCWDGTPAYTINLIARQLNHPQGVEGTWTATTGRRFLALRDHFSKRNINRNNAIFVFFQSEPGSYSMWQHMHHYTWNRFFDKMRLSVSLPACLSLPVCLSLSVSVCLSVWLSVYLFVFLTVCFSLCLSLSVGLSLSLSLSLSLRLFLSASVSLSLSLSVSVSLSLCLSVWGGPLKPYMAKEPLPACLPARTPAFACVRVRVRARGQAGGRARGQARGRAAACKHACMPAWVRSCVPAWLCVVVRVVARVWSCVWSWVWSCMCVCERVCVCVCVCERCVVWCGVV